MRYPASETLEIIRLVEESHLPVKHTRDMLGIPKTTFYRWYDRFVAFGGEPVVAPLMGWMAPAPGIALCHGGCR